VTARSAGAFVAVGHQHSRKNHGLAAVLTSTDGVTWTPRETGISNGLYAVTFGNVVFVAVGNPGQNIVTDPAIYTSSDGVVWTKRDTGFTGYLRVHAKTTSD
jgi:hypothetical protein